ncbi:hypothetical protein ACTMTI_48080 [Nonomuraea sp. H19]|uniref:hypothetical protein n=1 Tax=Nonomuraea sp. H19 TaxID=3452206 RepID=UPI003F8C0B4E
MIIASEQQPASASASTSADDGKDRLPGSIAAALIAAGIGGVLFGLSVILAEHLPAVKRVLTLSEAVGPLSGKAVCGAAAYALSWLALHLALRGRTMSGTAVARITGGLLTAALVFTFPPVYMLFATH